LKLAQEPDQFNPICDGSDNPYGCQKHELLTQSVVTAPNGGIGSPCAGDSGGPLLALTEEGKFGTFGIVGITSRVATLEALCDGSPESARTIFTNLLDPDVQAAIKDALKEMGEDEDEIESKFFFKSNFDPEKFINCHVLKAPKTCSLPHKKSAWRFSANKRDLLEPLALFAKPKMLP